MRTLCRDIALAAHASTDAIACARAHIEALGAQQAAALRVRRVAHSEGGWWRVPDYELRALLAAVGVKLTDEGTNDDRDT